MLRLLITRHGETNYNIENRIQGCVDTELTSKGIEQAGMLADYFKETYIDYVISSNLTRTTQTAEIIARQRGISVIHDNRLNERDWGRFNGQHESDIDTGGISLSRYLFYKTDPNDDSNPNIRGDSKSKGETIAEVLHRVGNFYDELVKRYEEATILLVGSQFSNAYLLNYILGVPPERVVDFVQENMCINNVIVYPPRKGLHREVEVIHINFRGHIQQKID